MTAVEHDPHAPYTLYKSDISYFSGKLEAYLHYKGIAHAKVDVTLSVFAHIQRHTGVQKMPAMCGADGKWLFDTTPMMAYLDALHPEHSVYPEDPALRFIALLLEDYGDEWLWRPAMWWRWEPPVSRRALGRRIAGEIVSPIAKGFIGWFFAQRQRWEWLWGDGMSHANSKAIRDMLREEFALLEPLLEVQPFLLGDKPSIADYGYFGPMFRHFGNDPEPAEVMRREAPNTYEWLARLWNAKPEKLQGSDTDTGWQWPEQTFWQPLWRRIAGDYLPYLCANADAFDAGKKRFDFKGRAHNFPRTKTTDYRVWCLQQLQREFQALGLEHQQRVLGLFTDAGESPETIETMLSRPEVDSGMDALFAMPREPLAQGEGGASSWVKVLRGQPRN